MHAAEELFPSEDQFARTPVAAASLRAPNLEAAAQHPDQSAAGAVQEEGCVLRSTAEIHHGCACLNCKELHFPGQRSAGFNPNA